MLIDSRDLTEGQIIEADLCIVGAGPAGISLARELENTGLSICLLESGGLSYDPQVQSLSGGDVVGLSYWPLDSSRVRFFGGTSNHWGGTCLPLEEDDFEQRSWVERSGWPFGLDDLVPYYRRAQLVCELGPYAYLPEEWEQSSATPLPLTDDQLVTRILRSSPPTRFGNRYRQDIAESKNTSAYLHCTVKEVLGDPLGRSVTEVEAVGRGNRRIRFRALNYVIAAGGIENARLLLLSNRANPAGLGNDHDLVGRYFADHVYLAKLGHIVLTRSDLDAAYYAKRTLSDGTGVGAYLAIAPETRRSHHLLTHRFQINEATWSETHKSVEYLSTARSALDHGARLDFLGKRLRRVLREFDDVTEAAAANVRGQSVLRFGAWTEQVPNPDSRITLSDKIDQLGQRRVVMDWRIGDQIKDSLMRSIEIMALDFGRSGIGRVKTNLTPDTEWPWTGGGTPGMHHMGTTRMHVDAKQGVVDENSLVHGTANLYVAGSSVFPTFGHANPTLTLLALTMRLADRLKETML